MAAISAEKLVGTLTDERNLDISARPFANKEHGQNRRRRYRLLHELDDAGERVFERPLVEQDFRMVRGEDGGRLCCVREFVVSESAAIADREGTPRIAIEIHKRQKQR